MTPILRAERIRVEQQGRVLLDVPELELSEGEVFVAIGPNGAGKSTLLRVLAALQRPQSGRLYVRGEAISWRRALRYRRRIAVVLQDPLLLSMSVYHNVALGLYLRRKWGRDVKTRVLRWLDEFQVKALARRPAHALSGGEAQRVALARAFVLEPDILFLDEPFAGLDMPTRLDILADLRRALQETGRTTFLVTHDRDEALALADRVAVLFDGRIQQVGSIDDVFLHPVNEQVAAFVGVENRVPVQVVRVEGDMCQVRFAWGDVAWVQARAAPGAQGLMCVRPEEVLIAPAEGAHPGGENVILGEVEQSILLGAQVRVVVRVGTTRWHVLVPRAMWRRQRLSPGTQVRLTLPPESGHLLLDKDSIRQDTSAV